MEHKHNTKYNYLLLKNRKLCAEIDLDNCSGVSDCLDRTAGWLSAEADIIRLCAKNTKDNIFLETSKKIKQLCSEFGALFIVKSRCDIAYLSEADGLTLSEEDISVNEARKLLLPNTIIGTEVYSREKALESIKNGAEYISIGLTFSAPNKPALDSAGLEYAKWVSENSFLPVFAHCDADRNNITKLLLTGISKITLCKAATNVVSPNTAAEKLAELLKSNS